MLSCGVFRTQVFENADVTACARIFGIHTRAFCLSVFGFRMSQRFRVDGRDNFENAPRVDADLFYRDKKYVFSVISVYVWWTGPPCNFFGLITVRGRGLPNSSRKRNVTHIFTVI